MNFLEASISLQFIFYFVATSSLWLHQLGYFNWLHCRISPNCVMQQNSSYLKQIHTKLMHNRIVFCLLSFCCCCCDLLGNFTEFHEIAKISILHTQITNVLNPLTQAFQLTRCISCKIQLVLLSFLAFPPPSAVDYQLLLRQQHYFKTHSRNPKSDSETPLALE